MGQKSGPVKEPAEPLVKEIRRATRRQFSAEEKIRAVLSGLRGEFVAIIDAGSLSGAAQRLRRSPRFVTRTLASLEARLGETLLQRTTRRSNGNREGNEMAPQLIEPQIPCWRAGGAAARRCCAPRLGHPRCDAGSTPVVLHGVAVRLRGDDR
jgi:hypothetical protein